MSAKATHLRRQQSLEMISSYKPLLAGEGIPRDPQKRTAVKPWSKPESHMGASSSTASKSENNDGVSLASFYVPHVVRLPQAKTSLGHQHGSNKTDISRGLGEGSHSKKRVARKEWQQILQHNTCSTNASGTVAADGAIQAPLVSPVDQSVVVPSQQPSTTQQDTAASNTSNDDYTTSSTNLRSSSRMKKPNPKYD
jgi:hypothetical protein